jgi:hypothetical protein
VTGVPATEAAVLGTGLIVTEHLVPDDKTHLAYCRHIRPRGVILNIAPRPVINLNRYVQQ